MALKIHSSFSVPSGGLCFGNRREIATGASAEIQPPSCPPFQLGGTVLAHSWKYNFAAVEGKWNVYRLVWKNTPPPMKKRSSEANNNNNDGSNNDDGRVCAAFVCHAETVLDPHAHVMRILNTANVPWGEFGTNCNTDVTWEGRVVVINRYDWDEDYYGEEQDGIRDGNLSTSTSQPHHLNSRYLVDHETARLNQEQWISSGHGVRLVVVGEYMYGRFGLVEDRSRVESFLFFSGDVIDFANVCFAHDDRPVFIPPTPEQIHARRLAEGRYTGFDWLRSIRSSAAVLRERGSLVEPMGITLLSVDELENQLKTVQPLIPNFAPELRDEMSLLLNESLCCWLQTLVSSDITGVTNRQDLFDQVFSMRTSRPTTSVDGLVVKAIEKNENHLPNLSHDALHEIIPTNHILWTFLTPREFSCAVRFVLHEVLELASNVARDSRRTFLAPCDIRIAIANDNELCEKRLNASTLFWPPDIVAEVRSAS